MDKSKFQVYIEAGHTLKTPGKCSPDASHYPNNLGELALKETVYCREIVKMIKSELDKEGIDYTDVTPDINAVDSLVGRANAVNSGWKKAKEKGKKASLYISIHNNAAGSGQWLNGRGWAVYTTKGKTKSDDAATIFWNCANEILSPLGFKCRKDMSDGDPDNEANFTVIYKSNIPAILTENLFQDNKEEVRFLLSDEGKKTIVKIHVEGIKKYIASLKD